MHGLGVSAAEGLAEWHHQRIREELGLEAERGKRYSFGYSACPDLADQAKVFKLLDPLTSDRRLADQRVPAGAGSLDQRDHRASSAGDVLHGEGLSGRGRVH